MRCAVLSNSFTQQDRGLPSTDNAFALVMPEVSPADLPLDDLAAMTDAFGVSHVPSERAATGRRMPHFVR